MTDKPLTDRFYWDFVNLRLQKIVTLQDCKEHVPVVCRYSGSDALTIRTRVGTVAHNWDGSGACGAPGTTAELYFFVRYLNEDDAEPAVPPGHYQVFRVGGYFAWQEDRDLWFFLAGDGLVRFTSVGLAGEHQETNIYAFKKALPL